MGRMKMGDRRDGRTDSGVRKRIHDDGIDGIVDNCRTQLRVSRRKWIREEDFFIERRGFLDFRAEVVGPKRRKTGIGSSAGRRVGPKREKNLNGPIRKREN